jgi:crossover junction endodeoxyribonuclease RuvC
VLVLGIDPGTRIAGYALVESDGYTLRRVASGVFKLNPREEISVRLASLHKGVAAILGRHSPSEAAVEKVFFGHNVKSALALGHGRGAMLAALGGSGIPVFEYAPSQVKKAVTGRGAATKEQVAKMVSVLFEGYTAETPDESDALAVAICHCNRSRLTEIL